MSCHHPGKVVCDVCGASESIDDMFDALDHASNDGSRSVKYDWPKTCVCGADFENGIGAIEVPGIIETTGYVVFVKQGATILEDARSRCPIEWVSEDGGGVCTECDRTIDKVPTHSTD